MLRPAGCLFRPKHYIRGAHLLPIAGGTAYFDVAVMEEGALWRGLLMGQEKRLAMYR